MKSAVTLNIDPETGLLEIVTSGGKLLLTQMEAALIYYSLSKTLGVRGRFKLWMLRKHLHTKYNDSGTITE